MNDCYKKVLDASFHGVVMSSKENEVLFENASGYLDISNQIDNKMDTKFALASGAKTFTAIAILSLVEEGKIKLTDSISQYMDETFLYDATVTIKELLSHTSGIPDYLDEELNLDTSFIPWHQLLKPSDYFQYFPIREMDFKPQERFKYNNGAFVILAYVIECVTGDFYLYMSTLLDKTGLKNTGYYRFDQLPSNTSYGYIIDNNEFRTNIYHLPIRGSGDGGIYSNVYDLKLLWEKLFSYQILKEETVDLMIQKHAFVKDNLYYGLGVWITDHNNCKTIKMIGQDYGVSFESSYDMKSKEITTVICSNDKDAWTVLKLLEEKISE